MSLNKRHTNDCWCEKRLKVKVKGSTHLTYNRLCGGLEHLKIETRLIDDRFTRVMGECVIVTVKVDRLYSVNLYWQSDPCYVAQSELQNMKRNGWFPDYLVKIEDTQIHYHRWSPRSTNNIRYKGDNVRGIFIIVSTIFSNLFICLLKEVNREVKKIQIDGCR